MKKNNMNKIICSALSLLLLTSTGCNAFGGNQTAVNYNEYVLGIDGPMSPNTYDKYFSKFMNELVEKAGLPKLTPHELRHTYGTIKREEGIDLYTIQKVMGHADISVTASIYVHNDIEVLRKQLKLDSDDDDTPPITHKRCS